MAIKFTLSEYVKQAMAQAVYDKLEDGTFSGRVPPCKGVVAFGATLRECEEKLRSTLEDWILVGLKLGHPLPVIAPERKAEVVALAIQRYGEELSQSFTVITQKAIRIRRRRS